APSSAAAMAAAAPAASMPAGRAMSQATASASQSNSLAPSASRTLWARDAARARVAGFETSVATNGMEEIASTGDRAPLKGAILIAGPTASGKSALALRLARDLGGIVVNADSMQVYSVLETLTARPGAAECAVAPHLLYGHVHPAEAY